MQNVKFGEKIMEKNKFSNVFYRIVGRIERKGEYLFSEAKKRELVRNGLQKGAGGWISSSAKLINCDQISIGDKCHINDSAYIIGPCKIGNYVTISNNAIILGTGYDTCILARGERVHKDAEVIIGDYVWIAAGAIICPGVKLLGKHIVVAAGAVVCHSIYEDDVVVAGVPAQIVKRL